MSGEVSEPTHLIRGVVITPATVLRRGWVAIRGGVIAEIGDGPAPTELGTQTDLGDRTIAPGFVDVHVHGGAGGQAAGDQPDVVAAQVTTMARFHAEHGTTCLLATTVSDTAERLLATVAGIRSVVNASERTAAVVAGIHLEGPWLSPRRRGAHDPTALRRPDPAELAALIEASGGALRMITLAPELYGAAELIAAATAHGVTVSVGHTEAGYECTRGAFDAGARHLTHLGNAMPGLDRREPGPIGAALTDERITVEVIADGQHVHPALLRVVAGAAPGRLVAITDAIAATGLPEGAHRVGRLDVTVAAGRAVLSDQPETLAGSVLTMDRAVATLVGAGVPLVEAIQAATATPAGLIGPAPGELGRGALAAGHLADLVVLDERLAAIATVIGGRVVHDRDRLLTALGSPPAPWPRS